MSVQNLICIKIHDECMHWIYGRFPYISHTTQPNVPSIVRLSGRYAMPQMAIGWNREFWSKWSRLSAVAENILVYIVMEKTNVCRCAMMWMVMWRWYPQRGANLTFLTTYRTAHNLKDAKPHIDWIVDGGGMDSLKWHTNHWSNVN